MKFGSRNSTIYYKCRALYVQMAENKTKKSTTIKQISKMRT